MTEQHPPKHDKPDNVVQLPPTSNMTVEEALACVTLADFKEVLIIGARGPDGALSIVSSKMTRQEALWLTTSAQIHAAAPIICDTLGDFEDE